MIGQRFGNYRALSLLGEGGMGAVYMAEHPDIGRRVAVKVLRPELIKDPQLLLRFLNEARAANAIRHPHIIEILDSGTTPEGTPYLVMELLEGEVLSARILRLGRLPLADVLEFSYQAASALGAAHEKGIIHRDLKPDNLFIVPDPSDPARERIKILDFGIAKLQTFPTGGGMQTRTGTLMGTPVYMSPEQCLGTKTIDHRSDIYAMGIIMYEMLAGRPPFMSEGFGDLVNMHLNVPARPLREIDPSIPPAVSDLVTRALEKAPASRQRSALDLQLDIRAAAGASAVSIGGASSPEVGRSRPTASGAPVAGGQRQRSRTPEDTGAARTPHGLGGTTLSTNVGERFATPPPVSLRAPRSRRFLLVGALVAAAAVAVVAGVRRADPSATATDRARAPAAPAGDAVLAAPVERAEQKQGAPAGPETRIRLVIESQPSGAAVTEVDSGRSLGLTPAVVDRAAAQGSVTVRLKKDGFESVTRAFPLDRDRTERVTLLAGAAFPGAVSAEAAAVPPPRSSARVPPGKSKKTGRPRPPAPLPETRPDDEPAKL